MKFQTYVDSLTIAQKAKDGFNAKKTLVDANVKRSSGVTASAETEAKILIDADGVVS